ncbi:MAG: hypothetical protein KUG77_16920, partial [Nannocystaceae bacterium]|nr:hypothetical protein [Nannocystaceae bacterium]
MKTDRADTTRTVHAGRYGRWAMLRIRVLFFTRTPDHAHILGATVWTGGHLVLVLVVLPRARRGGDPSVVQEFE